MIKKLLLFMSVLLVTEFTFAQQLPHYSLYMFNDAIINPAVVGTKNHGYATVILRDQWTGFEGAPKTQLISLEKKYDQLYGIGGGIINDKTGPISSLSGMLSVSYRVPFNNNTISFGASAIITQYKFDNSQITLENDGIIDPAMQVGVEQVLAHSITFGAQYIHDNYYIGASIPNIMSSKLNVNKNAGRNRLINHYYVNAGYYYELNGTVDIEPSIMFKKTGPTPLQMDLNLRGIYDDFIWAGLSFRTQDAVVMMLGLDYLDYRFGYSYDITTTALSIPSSGSHGLMFSYRIKHVEKDSDKDGFLDKDDNCPKTPGDINGCPDTDRDGIIDREDECPYFPGLKKNNGCPDKDSDGIIDKYDHCPDIPGLEEHNGCPDTDQDGLRDDVDKCPLIKGEIECIGCPCPDTIYHVMTDTIVDTIIILVNVKDTITYLETPDILFEHNMHNLSYTAISILNEIANYLNTNSDIRLRITGHTDQLDTEEYNLELSRKRAESVRDYLINKKQIGADRLVVKWKGELEPVEPGSESIGQPRNRRVSFTIINK